MAILNKLTNTVIDLFKIIFIGLCCLFFIIYGSYIVMDISGFIPPEHELYRTMSFETFMTDLPYIGNNMIFVIIFFLIVAAYLIITWFYHLMEFKPKSKNEEVKSAGEEEVKPVPVTEAGSGKTNEPAPEKPVETVPAANSNAVPETKTEKVSEP